MNYPKLPKGHIRTGTIDLESRGSREKRTVNLLAMLLAIATAMLGHLWHPFDEAAGALLSKGWVLLALIGVLFAQLLLHELIHGLMIRHFSGQKPRYGKRSIYVYAGSSFYFDKRSYIAIALAPALIWGVLLLVLGFVLPAEWFWPVCIVQVANLAGSASDFYSALRVARSHKEILVQALGTGMKLYAPEK